MPNSNLTSLLSRRELLAAAGIIGLTAATGLPAAAGAQAAEYSWGLLEPEVSPPARWDHTLGANPGTKQLVLFGGRDSSGGAFGDTWIYDLADENWRQVETSGPSPRFGQAVALDEASGKLVLFGGQSNESFFNDTWLFDFDSESWSQLETGESPLPSPRYGLPGAFDGDGRFIISHGFTFEGRFDDTWALDLASGAWTDISPSDGGVRPLKRCLHEMVWHSNAKRMVLFGGCSSGFGPCPQGDLWSFDPKTSAWTELAPAEGPLARSNPALAYDKNGRRMLLVGGLTDSGYTADVWESSGKGDSLAWSVVEIGGDGPSPRASHDIVLVRDDLYLFGGTGDAGVTNDLWKLRLG